MASAAPTRSGRRVGPSRFWRRTPFVLVRFPALLAALLTGALLLALTVSAHPLFLDARSSELLREEIGQPLITRYGAGIRYVSTNLPLDAPDGGLARVGRKTSAFSTAAARSDLLGRPVEEVLGPVVNVSSADRAGRDRLGRPFFGTDAVDHVEVVDGGGPGVWVPQVLARPLRVHPGDQLVLQLDGRRRAVPVAGVYRDLYAGPRRGYWLPLADQIWGERPDSAPLPQPILFEREDFFTVSRALRVPSADVALHSPLASPETMNLSDARTMSSFVARFRDEAGDRTTEVGGELRCCFSHLRGRFGSETRIASSIDIVLSIVAQRLVGIEGPTRLLEVVAALVSLAVIAAGGAFGAGARRAESRLLMARGRGVGTLAARSALESFLPCLLGGALGFLSAIGLVVGAGPEDAVGGSSVAAAGAAATAAVIASVVVVAIASVAMSLTHSDYHRSRFGLLARVPWELALIAFAVFAYDRVREQLLGTDLRAIGVAPTLYLFLFPIAGIAGVAVLGARAFRAVARWVRDRARGLRPPGYLAVHRVSDATGLALLLFAASTLAMGIFVQGRTVVGSLDRAVQQKADVFVGSDVQAWVSPDQEVPPDFPLPATRVVRVAEAGTIVPGGAPFDLLAIDPATFASAAAWSDTFSEEPLETILARLEPSDGSAPVLVVGTEIDVTLLELVQRRLTTETVGHATAFPGMVSRRPMIVMDRGLLAREYEGATGPLEDPDARPEIWIRGEHEAATAAAYSLDTPPFSVFGGEDVENIPYIDAMIDMFGVLDGLGLAAAVLVVLALAMYLQARQRSQLVAYGLSRRMGMARAGHRRALVAEVGSILASSWLLGTGLAIVVGVLLVPLLDPLPSVPPDPFVRPPLIVVAAALAGIVLVSALAARLIEARARSSYLGEVLRVDE